MFCYSTTTYRVHLLRKSGPTFCEPLIALITNLYGCKLRAHLITRLLLTLALVKYDKGWWSVSSTNSLPYKYIWNLEIAQTSARHSLSITVSWTSTEWRLQPTIIDDGRSWGWWQRDICSITVCLHYRQRGRRRPAARPATTPTTKDQGSCSQAVLGATMTHRGEETTAWPVLQPPRHPIEAGGSSSVPKLHKVNTTALRWSLAEGGPSYWEGTHQFQATPLTWTETGSDTESPCHWRQLSVPCVCLQVWSVQHLRDGSRSVPGNCASVQRWGVQPTCNPWSLDSPS